MTVAAWPSIALGQSSPAIRRVAVLISAAQTDPEGQARLAGLRAGLKELGWVEGRNIALDVRFAAASYQVVRDTVAEFTAAAPDVMIVNSTPALAEAYKATQKKPIPVIFSMAVAPVELGYIESLSRPGGNITGFTFIDSDLIGKWLQILKEAVPALRHVTLVHNPDNTPYYDKMIKATKDLPGASDIQLRLVDLSSEADIAPAFDDTAREPGGAVIVPPDAFNLQNRAAMVAASLRTGLPLISVYRPFAALGGLMTYGPDVTEIFRQSAGYVDRILKGTKPSDLPAQAPTKYDFVINAGTARKIGLTLPRTLYAAADEVIE